MQYHAFGVPKFTANIHRQQCAPLLRGSQRMVTVTCCIHPYVLGTQTQDA